MQQEGAMVAGAFFTIIGKKEMNAVMNTFFLALKLFQMTITIVCNP